VQVTNVAEPGLAAWAISTLVIAGWAGRDTAALEAHIRELEAMGIARPRQTPMFYEIAAANLTHAGRIEVAGDHSSGEVECVLSRTAQGLWLGVGSDHTDRLVETRGVTYSKQICPKPVAAERWAWADVEGHYERLVLRSWATFDGVRQVYQQGSVTGLRHPLELVDLRWRTSEPPVGAAIFCGTLPVEGQIRFSERFEFELYDPVLERSLRHAYEVAALPIVD
jgi:hypothetical protein